MKKATNNTVCNLKNVLSVSRFKFNVATIAVYTDPFFATDEGSP